MGVMNVKAATLVVGEPYKILSDVPFKIPGASFSLIGP